MSEGDLSAVGRTAFAVALARAVEAGREHPWFVDPLAVRLAASVPQTTRERVGASLIAWVATRTRFIDVQVEQAVSWGTRQVVVVGAGLDARAFRLDLPEDLTVFEIDRDDVFLAKQRVIEAARLHRAGRREIVVDVRDENWVEELAYAGWRSEYPTLWILEGFLVYLDEAVRTRLVSQLAGLSAQGSDLAATIGVRSDAESHPLWHSFADTDVQEWFASCGWVAEVSGMEEMSNKFGRPLPPGLSEHVTGALVSAQLA